MYDTAGIEHWIAVSKPTCDDGGAAKPGTGAKASSKRLNTTPDPDSSQENGVSQPLSINTRAFKHSDVDKNALLGFKDLVNKVVVFAQGVCTVPAELHHDLREDPDASFAQLHVYYTTSHSRSSLGASPTLAEIDRIVDQAQELRDEGDSEAAYNSLVHEPLLALALSLSPHAKRVAVKNIVHATISPASLLPLGANNLSVRSKMVDWAVVLRPVGALGGALARARQQPDGDERFFNHSRYRSLIDKPFAISVETKPEGEDIRQAYIQLAVWTSTHMNFLSQLLGDTASSAKNLPHLPLLIVQGSLWSFLCASRKADGSTDIHTKIDFGDASTRYGVFIIVSVLQLLVDWAEVHYRPWFEEHCVVKE